MICPLAFGRLVTLVDVTEQLGSLRSEEATALWMEPSSPGGGGGGRGGGPTLVSAIFECVQRCEAELLLPIKMPGSWLSPVLCTLITVSVH